MKKTKIIFSFFIAVQSMVFTNYAIAQFTRDVNLSNPDATTETKALKAFLDDTYGYQTISGQYGDEWCDWVKSVTGETPAILGLDFMNITPVRLQNGANPQDAEKGIDWVNNNGGIITISWHWDAPRDVTGDWWSAFYTNATSFDLEYAMNNPNSEHYQLLVRDIDLAAVELQKLEDAGVPVLWRPLHEAEGGWFWWGAKGAEPCKKLWNLMYDRLVNHHGLDNLIWVWNSYNYSNSWNWYPGDDVVDIIAYDYPTGSSWNNYHNTFGTRKMYGLAEVSNLPDPNNFNNESWLYFVTWVNFVQDNNAQDFVYDVYNNWRVASLEDLPDLKTYGMGTNYALNKSVTVSSTEDNNNVASNITDGSSLTRWSSEYSDPQWVSIDLGENINIEKVVLRWEAAYAKSFSIEVSDDEANWTTIFQTTNGDGELDYFSGLSGSGRYLRIMNTERGTEWGYSLYEVEVYGTPAVITSGHDAVQQESFIDVYPNPVTGEKVSFHSTLNNVQLYNSLGEELIYRSSANALELNGLPPGIYILKATEGAVKLIKK